MTSPNKYQRIDFHESPVDGRYSFADRELLRGDSNFTQGAVKRRVITYPTPLNERKDLRDSLISRGLLLGQIIENISNDQRLDSFMVPPSARPLSYESAAADPGAYSYNDTSLFYDLGKLLGSVAKEGKDQPLVLDEEIGHNVAIVEFTRVNESKILLVPGFEFNVREISDDDQALNIYGKKLYDEFGKRFDYHADLFIEGFRTTVG